ncbi:polysaccharide deacetylase family protein [Marinobacter sp.]|uniref:polysaccharide deacetylase family protein n=1 Tax=Marinobacter sp. TaxID=50741 RepID=UPI0035C694DF
MNFSSLVRLAGRCGGYRIARQLTARHPRILMYHRFSKESGHGVCSATFERQVAYMARYYCPMTVTQLVQGHFQGGGVPKHAVAITVDDGYYDFYEVAWPILKRYGVPATFYVTTGFIDGELWLWPDQLGWLLEHAPSESTPFEAPLIRVTPPKSLEDREQTFNELVFYLLGVPDDTKHNFLKSLASHWSLDIPQNPPKRARPVTWEQLAEMQREGLEVGGHTVSHPTLGQVSLEQARREILGSSETLDRRLGSHPRSFCYPNGTPSDFIAEHVPIVKEAGFTAAVMAFSDAQSHDQRYALRRHASSEEMFQFYKAVSGLELLGHRLRRSKLETSYE